MRTATSRGAPAKGASSPSFATTTASAARPIQPQARAITARFTGDDGVLYYIGLAPDAEDTVVRGLQGGDGGTPADAPGGGGGDGYFGGGGGAASPSGANGGGGGGSSFASGSLTSTTKTSGSGQTPGNSGDADRGTAGAGGATVTGGNNGRIVVYVNGVLHTTFDYTGSTQTFTVP